MPEIDTPAGSEGAASHTFHSLSPDATRGFAADFSTTLRGGEIVALTGDLGAGKTCFVTGLVHGLGSEENVGSPTFGLVREYTAGRIPVAHFDFYRLKSERELWELGWDDYLENGGVLLVEWAELFPDALPSERTIHVRLEAGEGETERMIRVDRPA